MLVEMMGPSGVGKSTVLEALLKVNSLDGRESVGKVNNIHDLRFFCDFFGDQSFLDGVISIISNSILPPTKKMAAIKIFNDTAIEYAKSKLERSSGRGHGIEIKDEFFLHRSYAVLLNSFEFEKDVKWYFKNVPAPDAVVIFKANSEVILDRIRGRGKVVNTYLYLDDESIINKIKRSEKMYFIAEEELVKRNVRVFHLNAEQNISKSVEKISAILDSLKECI
ncbi:hypothetical protein ACGK9R_16750 [Halomonas sp. HNIBRBA4712]|uniref:hypothetical protein n=1 Tax=Halomonas sp. HNIBRBA4712 TaxID=3373087 RepID=UPI003746CBD6